MQGVHLFSLEIFHDRMQGKIPRRARVQPKAPPPKFSQMCLSRYSELPRSVVSSGACEVAALIHWGRRRPR